MERLSEVFRGDHRRCETILAELEERAAVGEWASALTRFASFRSGIEKHMLVEEECLFPAVEAGGAPAALGLIGILRKGHRDLRVFLDELHDVLAAHDEEEFRHLVGPLRGLLQLHDQKEEAELYPAAEACLGDGGAAAVVRLVGG